MCVNLLEYFWKERNVLSDHKHTKLQITLRMKPLKTIAPVLLGLNLSLIAYSQTKQITPYFEATDYLKDAYGVVAHVTWKGYDYEELYRCLAVSRDLGINFIRTDYNLPSDPQSYNIYIEVDQLAQEFGIGIIPIITIPASSKDNTTDRMIPYYRKLDSLFPKNHFWEIYNEPDLYYMRNGIMSVGDYCNSMAFVNDYLKKKDDCLVLGGLSYPEEEYAKCLLERDASKYYDVFNFHYYSSEAIPESILLKSEAVSQVMNEAYFQKSVWLTETGYRTISGPKSPDLFFTEILPDILMKVGIKSKRVTLGILYDYATGYTPQLSDNYNMVNKFNGWRGIALDELNTVNPTDIPVIVVLSKDSFPLECLDGLESFLKHGGTIVFPEGVPFYYESGPGLKESNAVGTKYHKRFHIGTDFNWDKKLKDLQLDRTKHQLTSDNKNGIQYEWEDEDIKSAFYLNGNNLKGRDSFHPFYSIKNGNHTFPVVALYNFNSDLKGNIIIQSKPSREGMMSEELQAIRLPRIFICAFAAGIEKVAWYDLRLYNWSLVDKDFRYKPSAKAYKTLTTMCPNGSSRPSLDVCNDVYVAKWLKPDGQIITAIWSSGPTNIQLALNGRARVYDMYGNEIRVSKQYTPIPEVIYLVGDVEYKVDRR